MRSRLLGIAGTIAFLATSCSSGGGAVTIDVTISGDGIDQALVYPSARRAPFAPDLELDPEIPYEYRGESMVVDLPWSTTITVDDGLTTEFEVAAFNQGESGELTCAADWNQAEGDGDWDRSNSYLVSCSGDFSFRDDGEVRLDPGGRSVSFEGRDERIAEIAEARRLEAERIARVDAAIANAIPPGPIELDGWSIELTGVNRDAEDLLEAHSSANRINGSRRAVLTEVTATRLASSPARAQDILVSALGGYELEVYDARDDDCGPHIPDSYLMIHGLIDEQQTGDEVVFNTCLMIDEEDADQALAVVSVFLGDDAPVTMRMPDSGVTGNREVLDASTDAVRFEEYEASLDLLVVDATVDDLDLLSERLGEEAKGAPEGKAYVMVDVEVTNNDPEGIGPFSPSDLADFRLESADGNTVYDLQDRCRSVFDLLVAEPAPADGVDWNDRAAFYAFPGEPRVFAACFEVDETHVAGSVLRIDGIQESVALATGL